MIGTAEPRDGIISGGGARSAPARPLPARQKNAWTKSVSLAYDLFNEI
jgi:hypothetical protein